VLARFVTAGHEPSTPSDISLPQFTGSEHKIIFRNSIPGKQRNLKRESIKYEGLPAGGNARQSGDEPNVLPCGWGIATV
jgi:hypothetical protein